MPASRFRAPRIFIERSQHTKPVEFAPGISDGNGERFRLFGIVGGTFARQDIATCAFQGGSAVPECLRSARPELIMALVLHDGSVRIGPI
jgi:hypothetical protein